MQPQVRDYGTLLELTADLDVHGVSMLSNVVMAALSNPIGSPGGVVQGEIEVGGADTSGGGAGGVGDPGGTADKLATAPAGDGKLPFTGFAALLAATAGAALVTVGAAVRAGLRRRP